MSTAFASACEQSSNVSPRCGPHAPPNGIPDVRRVCVFTANRADYSKLRPLIAAIHADVDLEVPQCSSNARISPNRVCWQCSVVIMGSHLLDDFGNTWKEVRPKQAKLSKTDPGNSSSRW